MHFTKELSSLLKLDKLLHVLDDPAHTFLDDGRYFWQKILRGNVRTAVAATSLAIRIG
jgi:hypothetical protein